MLIKVGIGQMARFAKDGSQRYVVFVIGVASELSPLGKMLLVATILFVHDTVFGGFLVDGI